MTPPKLIIAILLRSLTLIAYDIDHTNGCIVFGQYSYPTNLNHDSVAIKKTEQKVTIKPTQADLIEASRLLSSAAGKNSNRVEKKRQIEHALNYALQAIALDSACVEAQLSYIIALGIIAEIASNSADKLQHAREIKSRADAILAMDEGFAPAHFIVGKWHLSLASCTWAERAVSSMLLGGFPKGVSVEVALTSFEKAISLNPEQILFHYNKALALLKLGRKQEAITALQHAVTLPEREPDDAIRKENCQNLIKKIKNH